VTEADLGLARAADPAPMPASLLGPAHASAARERPRAAVGGAGARVAPGATAGSSVAARGATTEVDPDDADADAALVIRSQSGDRVAFEQLVHRTARLLFARLYVETADPHKAEDLVQETYLVAWRSIGQVTEPAGAGFRTWLLSVAHTVAIDAARRENRKKRTGPRLAGDATEVLAAVPDAAAVAPDEAADRDEQRRRVLAKLRELPEEYRQPIMLRYLAGADYDTIGRQLGLTNGSLRGLLNRGMARLREMMK
jgi:RNA polymerase sigma-70 factor, ECF subfamily